MTDKESLQSFGSSEITHAGFLEYLYQKWGTRIELFKNIEGLSIKDAKIFQARTGLYRSLNELGIESSIDLEIAEMFLWEAMEGRKPRKDGDPYEVHSYDVASTVLRQDIFRGSGFEEAIVALLHDTVEDSDGKVSMDHIEAVFGLKMHRTVDALTKISTRGSEMETLDKLFTLIEINPQAIAVKLADRLCFWNTIENAQTGELLFKPESIKFKAWETLYAYLPLATGLGLDYAGRVIGDLAVKFLAKSGNMDEFVLDTQIYNSVLNAYKKFGRLITRNFSSEWIIESRGTYRVPTAVDAFKLTGGQIEEISQASLPAYVVYVVSDAATKSSDGPDPWCGKVDAIISDMHYKGLISPEAYQAYRQINWTSQSHVRLKDLRHDVPVTIIFVREDDDLTRRVTVFDQRNPIFSTLANDKIHALQKTYEAVRKMGQKTTIEDMTHCLYEGAKEVTVNGAKIGISLDGTVTDALIMAGESWIYSDETYLYIKNGKKWKIVSPDDVINSNSELKAYRKPLKNGDKAARFGISWMDAVKMPSSKRMVREELKKSVLEEIINERWRTTGSTVEQLINRADRMISREMDSLALGLEPERRFQIVVRLASLIYQSEEEKYFCRTTDYRDYFNFMINVGLEESGYSINDAQTGLVWDVIKYLNEIRKNSFPFKILLSDKPGTLNKFTQDLESGGINILHIESRKAPMHPDCQEAVVWIEVGDKEKIVIN